MFRERYERLLKAKENKVNGEKFNVQPRQEKADR